MTVKDVENGGDPTVATAVDHNETEIVCEAEPIIEPQQVIVDHDIESPMVSSSTEDKNTFDITLFGSVRVRDRHIRPGRSTVIMLCGEAEIDIHDAQFPPNCNRSFLICMLCGDVKVSVPRGVAVSLRRFLICGEKDIDIDETAVDDESSSKVTITLICPVGGIHVSNEQLSDSSDPDSDDE